VKGTKVIYLTGADSDETEIRRRAKSIGHNDGLLTVEQPDEVYCVVTNDVFLDELKANIIEGKYDVLVLDTVADYHEGNTYEAELVNKSMARLRRFVKETNIAIILITHTKKGSKVKAEYNVEDIADSRIFTSKADFVFGIRSEYQSDGSNLIELQCLKSRAPRAMPFTRAEIAYSEGFGLQITRTERKFKAELEQSNEAQRKKSLILEAKRLHGEGNSMSQIADSLGIGKSTAHKYIKTDNGIAGLDIDDVETTETQTDRER
jgi:predicted ATP-dependent serine protease